MDKESGKYLGMAITKSRKKAKLTQEQIAAQISISTRTYQAYEAGEVLPRYETLFNIAHVTNTSATALLKPMWEYWKNQKVR